MAKVEDVFKELTQTLESKHFTAHFALRNPSTGRGSWVGGVRSHSIVNAYLDGLERLYDTMVQEPWKREPPSTGRDGKIKVGIFDTSKLKFRSGEPFTDFDWQRIPFICLPHQNSEPTSQGETRLAMAQAIHEAAHVFNWCRRHPLDINSGVWEWFDEALAIFMETLVMSGIPEHLRYVMYWNDMPEVSLDDYSARYQASMFVRYLAKRHGVAFVNKVWMESRDDETPIQALARISQEANQVFSSHDPAVEDLFASGYCVDSYFLLDPKSDGFAPHIYERFRDRSIQESFRLRPGCKEESNSTLNHLACHYYRFYAEGHTKSLQVRMKVDSSKTESRLKAQVATVTKGMQRGRVQLLMPVSSDEGDETVLLSAELNEVDVREIDHLVLIVSNCGYRDAETNPEAYYDEQLYTIEIECGEDR